MGLAPRRIRSLLVDGLLVAAVLASVVTLAAAPPGAASVSSAGDAGSVVHGDRRTVAEPVAPATTCATVPAAVAMAERQGSAGDEAHAPDTARIQAALDGCAGSGGAVVLAASATTAAFLSAPITVRAGEVLVLDPSVVLHASRSAADYQVAGRATCGTVAGAGDGCRPFVTLSSHSGLESGTATGLGQGRVDGRGDLPILGGTRSWWQVAADAKQGGHQNVPRLVAATRADDVTLHDVDLVDSPGTHVSFDHGDGLTVWGVVIRTPAGARNTDGIDPAGATDVTIARSWISAGDDGIAVKAGTAASAHISVLDDHLYGTHGVAIGSETQAGVSDVLVARVTVSGRDAFGTLSVAAGGIRIKGSAATGGLVQDVEYRDVCVDEVKQPLAFDPRYSTAAGISIPTMTGIVVDGFRATRSLHLASSELDGYDAAHPLGLALRRTAVDAAPVDMAAADITTAGATFGGVPLASTASDVRVTAGPHAGDPPTCAFPAFPDL
jgi:polygalacturonase